jgi:methylaspartate ammonia-lyase
METENIMYDALLSHFVAQQKKAIATIGIYFKNPVGIGEHPQIIDEMVEQTKSLAEAVDCIEILRNTFETAQSDE